MYQVFLGYVPLPIAPSAIKTTINSRNQTIDLIDGREINILKESGLQEISFDFLLPHQSYPFVTLGGAITDKVNSLLGISNIGSMTTTTAMLYYLEYLKSSKAPFQFVVARLGTTDGKSGVSGLIQSTLNMISAYNSTVKVSLESYTIDEDAEAHGFDFMVSVVLKQYQTYSVTQIVNKNIQRVRA